MVIKSGRSCLIFRRLIFTLRSKPTALFFLISKQIFKMECKIMYRLSRYNNTYIPYEVIKETSSQVVYLNSVKREDREAKITNGHTWHNSEKECLETIIAKLQKDIEFREMTIMQATSQIEKIKTDILEFTNKLNQ